MEDISLATVIKINGEVYFEIISDIFTTEWSIKYIITEYLYTF